MIRSDVDLPYLNQVLVAHRAANIAYRAGPAHKVQVVVPSVPPPTPKSATIRTLRRKRPSSDACMSVHAAPGIGNTDADTISEATKAEEAETGYTENHTSSYVEHEEERYLQSRIRIGDEADRPRDRGLGTADSVDDNNQDTLCENDNGNYIALTVLRTHEALYAADFEDTDDEESLCDDVDTVDLDLERDARCAKCNEEVENPQRYQLTTIQLRIQENTLREIVQQALKARRNGRSDSNSSIFSEAPEEEDRVLEMVLELTESGKTMNDAGTFLGDEEGDIEIMLRNNLQTLIQKATRPFRPSGIRAVRAELSQFLEDFRRMRLRLLQENPGMSMAGILKERSLDLRPRQP